jgi:hypothetical protein
MTAQRLSDPLFRPASNEKPLSREISIITQIRPVIAPASAASERRSQEPCGPKAGVQRGKDIDDRDVYKPWYSEGQ